MNPQRDRFQLPSRLSAMALGLTLVHLSALSSAQSTPASSSNAGNPQALALEEIVVTAQRREQRLSDVGMSVNAVDGEFLAQRNITSASDLAQVVSALLIVENADGTPVYTLRGVGYNAISLGGQPSVSVYTDEASLPYAPMTRGPLYDLERVEVLKGPQGTLYGQNSTGGAINYIVAKPTEQFSAGVSVGAGRFDTFRGSGFLSGPLSETIAARLSVDGVSGGDWQKSYLRPDSIGEQRKYAARLQTTWTPTDSVRGYFNINGWVDKSDNQIPQFIEPVPRVPTNVLPDLLTLPSAPRDDRAADWTANTDFGRDNRQWQATARFDIDLTPQLTLTSLSNYVRVEVESRYDNDATAFNLAQVTIGGTVDSLSQEFRLAGQFGDGRGNFLAGANYQTDDDEEYFFVVFDGTSSTVNISSPPLPPPGLGTLDESITRGKQANDTIAVFGNVEWQLTEKLTVLGGARYTEVEHKNRTCTADTGQGDPTRGWAHIANGLIGLLSGTPGTLQPGDCVTLDANLQAGLKNESFTETNVSWRGGLNYKPTEDSLLYGLISRGFKAGNYPVFSAISASSLRPVVQEELTSYELGAKANFARMFGINAAVYYYDYKDKQLLTVTPDPVFGLVETLGNVPKSHAYGVDLETTLTPMRGLTLRSAVAYQKTHVGPFIDYNILTGEQVQLQGNSFNYAPEWTVTADGEYRFDISPSKVAFIGASLLYNSETNANLAGASSLRIASFTTLGARAGVEAADGRWQAMLWADNLTDKYYWTNAVYGYDTLYRLTGRPLSFGLNFTYRL